MPARHPHAVRPLPAAWRDREPPELSRLDRLALRVGLALVLWGRRRAPLDRGLLAEQVRLRRLAEAAWLERDRAQARRLPGGQIL